MKLGTVYHPITIELIIPGIVFPPLGFKIL
jgi:hypothetical protein